MEYMIPIALFAMIAVIAVGPRYLQSKERQKLQDTLRAAIEKGQAIPPEVIDAISRDVKVERPPTPERDMRRGIVWLGAGLGLAAFGLVMGYSEPDATYPMVGFAAFPVFIGLAFIVVALMNRAKS